MASRPRAFTAAAAAIIATMTASAISAAAGPNAQTAERQALSGDQIRARIVGVMLHWTRPRQDDSKVELWAIVRPDGSFMSKCEFYNGRMSDWSLCRGSSGNFGGWANGVWQIENDQYCSNTVVTGYAGRACFRLYDDSGRLFVEQVSGNRRSSFRGIIGTEPLKDMQCVGNLAQKDC